MFLIFRARLLKLFILLACYLTFSEFYTEAVLVDLLENSKQCLEISGHTYKLSYLLDLYSNNRSLDLKMLLDKGPYAIRNFVNLQTQLSSWWVDCADYLQEANRLDFVKDFKIYNISTEFNGDFNKYNEKLKVISYKTLNIAELANTKLRIFRIGR